MSIGYGRDPSSSPTTTRLTAPSPSSARVRLLFTQAHGQGVEPGFAVNPAMSGRLIVPVPRMGPVTRDLVRSGWRLGSSFRHAGTEAG
jgi:hypothetical protein